MNIMPKSDLELACEKLTQTPDHLLAEFFTERFYPAVIEDYNKHIAGTILRDGNIAKMILKK